MTHTYIFILGRKALLSIAELMSVLPPNGHVVDVQREALVLTLAEPLMNPQQVLNRLGGSVKIGQVFAEIPATQADISTPITTHLLATFPGHTGKLVFAVSLYSFTQSHEGILKKTLNFVKKALKNEGITGRYINKNFKNPENAAIHGEKLVASSNGAKPEGAQPQTAQPNGAEILVMQGHHRTFLAQTVALQDFENYSFRDFDRPERDARLGMLPPKLAQVMINLSGLGKLEHMDSLSRQQSGGSAADSTAPVATTTSNSLPPAATSIAIANPIPAAPSELLPHPHVTIYDPFCGMGTILTEALIMGYSVLGSDIDASVIEKAKKNIEFTKNNTWTYNQNVQLFVADATHGASITHGASAASGMRIPNTPHAPSATKSHNTSTPLPKLPIRAVVTESYLGPPKSRFPGADITKKTLAQTADLMNRFLAAIRPLLADGTPLIVSIPVYRDGQKLHFFDDYQNLSFHELAAKNRFKTEPLIPKNLIAEFSIPSAKESLVYDRPDQVVGREIWRLRAK